MPSPNEVGVALEWARENAHPESLHVVTDGRINYPEHFDAYSYRNEVIGGMALLIVDGLRKFPARPIIQSCMFLVSNVSRGSVPLQYYVASWHQSKGWVLLHEYKRGYACKPWQRCYSIVVQ